MFKVCIATLYPINIHSYWPDTGSPPINQMIRGGIKLWDPSYPENNADSVRATAVGRDVEWDAEQNVVLAGDPKIFRLLCNK